jgi:hypothetical protein
MEIRHILGKEHKNTDALSRLPTVKPPTLTTALEDNSLHLNLVIINLIAPAFPVDSNTPEQPER